MATPGVGTIVRYHSPNEYCLGDYAAVVVATHDSWTTTMGTNGGSSLEQPDTDQVLLSWMWVGGSGTTPENTQFTGAYATEGTDLGQFSLIVTETEDV
jgi:hypothetical protein